MSGTTSGTPTAYAERRPALLAALFVLPYLLFSLSWAVSNPPGAAPDEQHHLVKAIGSGSFQLGRAGPPPASDAPPNVVTRNASITRIYRIPERLVSGQGYRCFAFAPDITADCLPDQPPGSGDGEVEFDTPMGAYPPFLYAPIGWATLATQTPEQAFVAGRLVASFLSTLLLWMGVTHAVRWLGRRVVLVFAVAMTPMAVYSTSILSISGIEIMASCAVAAVVLVALRRPESVHAVSTHLTLLTAGVALALGRQLGALSLGLMLLVLLVAAGRQHLTTLLRTRPPTFLLTVVGILAATVTVAAWELTYDHPSNTGSVLNSDAVLPFVERSYGYLVSSIGLFGWLDTRIPGPATGAWLTLWVVVVGFALIVGRRRDAVIIALGLIGLWTLAFALYASVFYTISADIQGRQFLGLTAFLVILAGGVVVDRLPSLGRAAVTRSYFAVALVVGVVQVLALYFNARRYAVGVPGPFWFVPEATWTPPGGFPPWLGLAAFAGVLLTFVVFSFRPRDLGADLTGNPTGQPTGQPTGENRNIVQDERVVDHVER